MYRLLNSFQINKRGQHNQVTEFDNSIMSTGYTAEKIVEDLWGKWDIYEANQCGVYISFKNYEAYKW